MRTNITILTEEDGASPARNPPMDAMNARVASLTSLEDMYKQAGVC